MTSPRASVPTTRPPSCRASSKPSRHSPQDSPSTRTGNNSVPRGGEAGLRRTEEATAGRSARTDEAIAGRSARTVETIGVRTWPRVGPPGRPCARAVERTVKSSGMARTIGARTVGAVGRATARHGEPSARGARRKGPTSERPSARNDESSGPKTATSASISEGSNGRTEGTSASRGASSAKRTDNNAARSAGSIGKGTCSSTTPRWTRPTQST